MQNLLVPRFVSGGQHLEKSAQKVKSYSDSYEIKEKISKADGSFSAISCDYHI